MVHNRSASENVKDICEEGLPLRRQNQHAKYEMASHFGMPTHSQFIRAKFVF